jgi:flavin-dependent dehydrogenase
MNKALTQCDVAIIGGGPGGSTTGTLLKKYEPDFHVVILERERFPRDHVGESQLPPIGAILHEMGCWDKVEAADFPIKVGATYRWGASPEMWDFNFIPADEFRDQPRPAPYAGQRVQTALQVDRGRYDEILLQHAAELGCEVRMETGVVHIARDQDRVTQLELSDGNVVQARWYVDASGHTGILRRAMEVSVECPTHLKNIAIWDYWQNASWAEEIGVGGTRVQLMSIPHGWIWFIPLGPTRTSIGLVCPAEHFKKSGLTTTQLYDQSVHQETRIAKLIEGGSPRGKVESTSDWSFLADRTVGENWFLVGESAGFADPILAAGMTLTHTGAREAAYSLLALMKEQPPHDTDWIKAQYDRNQRARIGQHIRFADFWYASNGQFTDLQDHCRDIASTAGLELSSQQAFAWLSQGGFTNDVVGQPGIGGLSLTATKKITEQFTGQSLDWSINEFNRFRLNLKDATVEQISRYADGRIEAITCYCRGERRLVKTGMFDLMIRLVDQHEAVEDIFRKLVPFIKQRYSAAHAKVAFGFAVQALEVMISEGWVDATFDPTGARLNVSVPQSGGMIHPHRDATGHRS